MSVVSAASGPSASRSSKGRILVVDDDRLVLATVTHGLSAAGYEVIDADNGDEAILLARQHRPALALLDIRMEGKSGFDVAETLRDAYGIPFMFLSAFADAATLAKVEELGALAYLIKPLDVGQIVPSVEAAFARIQGQDGGVAGAAQGTPGGLIPHAAPAVSPAPTAPTAPTISTTTVLLDPVPLAVGVLMHRYSLPRDQALARLQRLAHDGGQSPAAQAERLLAAVEELARSAL